MGRLKWLSIQTAFFFRESPGYMKGIRTTPLDWARAYYKFVRLSWKDMS